MRITVNGDEREVEKVRTLEELLRALGVDVDRGGIAVARNETVVPRARWREIIVEPGDRLEIIAAVQGG